MSGNPSSPDAATIQARLVAMLASRLGPAPERLDLHTRFSRLGADSRTMTGVLAELASELGRPLRVTLAWEHPSIAELAAAIARGADAEPSAPRGDAPALRSASSDVDEPVAIVGLACRFPGATSPEAFFDMLTRGVDAVRELPAARFDVAALYDADPEAPGRASTRWAGLLDEVDRFDAPFFGISRREATHMDPQQRLILELAWEALEDAGSPPRALRGSRTGVFIGAMWSDYAALRRGSLNAIAQHTAVGEDLSVIPARVSYGLGLEGPSLSVSTACSSSLVALHLACQSVARGECTMALAGAVNLLLAPDSLVAMSKFGAMAPDGRSKAFDARANGYVRGEGGGVVVLKRLSQARADGDHVYAVVLGSAVNNDGFSNGLTAPNPKAQQSVLREAYSRAGVDPAEVAFVETHGTGTLLGDPIEATALGAVLGQHRRGGPPLWIGSVKTNIGHLEAAAGMAGLIKACLAVSRGEIPPNLHFESPNPHIPFAALGIAVPTTRVPWPAAAARRVAGVSSFGFGGTNAHVVLASDPPEGPYIVPLRALDAGRIRHAARSAVEALERGDAVGDVVSAALAAAEGEARAGIVAGSRSELVDQLRALAETAEANEAVRVETAAPAAAKTLFVFAPNGSQYRGMARTLLRDPIFSRAFAACDAACGRWLDWSLREELLANGDEARLDRIDVGQPLLFAVQYALASRLQAWGIRPDAVLGHSVGEVAAACVAGALDVTDAARVVVHRSRLMQLAAGRGAMALVELAATEVAPHLDALGGALQIAGYNGPRNTVVSGDADAVARLLATLGEQGIGCHRVKRTDIGAHSAHMDPYCVPLREALDGLYAAPSCLPIYSTVTGGLLEGYLQDADYWPRNLREPVAFDATLRAALADGYSIVVEISPHPLLTPAIAAIAAARGDRCTIVAAQHRDQDARTALVATVAELYRRRHALDWSRFGALPPSRRVEEPELFCVSAETPEALAEAAERCAAAVAECETSLPVLCQASAARRSHHSHRAGLVADSHGVLAEKLERLASTVRQAGARPTPREPAKVVFVFSGQGPQWWAMGRELLATEPVFHGVVAACDRLIRRAAGWSLLEALTSDERDSRIHDVDVTQPALFAVQAGLFVLLRAWGLRPDTVVGHSLGEIAAAYAAGVLSFADAVNLTVARARAMRGAVGRGRMLAADLPATDVDLARYGARVSLAAVNGPRAIVFAGDPDALAELQSELAQRGAATKFLRGELAFHSEQMRPAQRELTAALAHLRPRAARLPLVSTVRGARVTGPELGAAYWGEQVVAPVRFAEAIDALLASGHTAFVEIGPHPALSSAIMQCLEARSVDGLCVPTLRRGKPERVALLEAIAALWATGHDVDLRARRPVTVGHAALPTYPWQRRRYWLEVPSTRVEEDASPPYDGTSPDMDEPTRSGPPLVEQLQAADERTRRTLLEQLIARRVAAILMLGPGEPLDVCHGFFELGMDSMMVTRLRHELQRDLQRTLPGPIVFDHPSVRRLATHLAAPHIGARPTFEPRERVAVVAAVETLSAEEVERQLLEELASLAEGTP